MTEIIRISKAGFDAVTGTAPDSLIYSSDYNSLKYHSSGSVVLVPGGADVQTSVAHNLGYVPFFIGLVNGFTSGGLSAFNMCPGTFSDAGFYTYCQTYADSTNCFFKVFTNSNIGTFTFRYFIFRNNVGL